MLSAMNHRGETHSIVRMNLLRRALNRILHILARFLPGATSIRPFLHKLRGVKIHGTVFIGDEVYLENEHPECIEIHDEAQIALRSIVMAHFMGGTGKVIIGKKVWIGPNCVIAARGGQTLTIGEGAALAASCVVTKDVRPYTFVGGVPGKAIAEITVPIPVATNYENFKRGLRPIKK